MIKKTKQQWKTHERNSVLRLYEKGLHGEKNTKSRGLGDSLMETKQKTQETKEKPKEPKKTVDQRSWGWGGPARSLKILYIVFSFSGVLFFVFPRLLWFSPWGPLQRVSKYCYIFSFFPTVLMVTFLGSSVTTIRSDQNRRKHRRCWR